LGKSWRTEQSALGCREHTRRVQSSPFSGQSIQLADVRTFRLGRYWGNYCPSGPGCDDGYCYILAARTERNYANRLNLAATVSFRFGPGVGEKVRDARTVSAVSKVHRQREPARTRACSSTECSKKLLLAGQGLLKRMSQLEPLRFWSRGQGMGRARLRFGYDLLT